MNYIRMPVKLDNATPGNVILKVTIPAKPMPKGMLKSVGFLFSEI